MTSSDSAPMTNTDDEKRSASIAHSDSAEARIVPMRLQKFLARAGVASRRGSENIMTAGRVCINGEIASELGTKVDPAVDVVTVDGQVVRLADGPVTLMLNKPAGVITTMKAQSDRPIVADLVPTERYPGLFPIGRLDADTTGLLLFSTDGELGNRLLHPRYHVEKTYRALLDEPLTQAQAERLRTGVPLMRKIDDGWEEEAVSAPAAVEILESGEVLITIHEGRYHQVKRMFDSVGRTVVALHRETFGPLSLGDLPEGAWRLLTDEEVAALSEER